MIKKVLLSKHYRPVDADRAIVTKIVCCETWCGGGVRTCSRTRMEHAERLAELTARQLGRGWTPRLNHNLGWFAYAVSPCNRIEVSISEYQGKRFFTASLGKFSGRGKTARQAVVAVIRTGVQYARDMAKLVEGLAALKEGWR